MRRAAVAAEAGAMPQDVADWSAEEAERRVAPPAIIIPGGDGGVQRIFDREIRLFYQPTNDARRLMQLWQRSCR